MRQMAAGRAKSKRLGHSRNQMWERACSRRQCVLIVPTLCVGTPQRTLCVRCWDAERPGLHSHAERGNDQIKRSQPAAIPAEYCGVTCKRWRWLRPAAPDAWHRCRPRWPDPS
ncbi:hypothetical protein C1893_19615 [Pseudomonas sp. MPR-ANC1]|nr:hypothetical protein C1893_19615 [Pseudomonas sp. MPR-ANC1]